MRLCHNQRRADVPLVLCLEIKNIKSTSGMFSNTQHDSRWRDNEVTVLVDESQPLWVYNQQFQVLTLVQRSRTAAVNHRVFYLCWIVYTKSCKMIWACCDGPGVFFQPKHGVSVTFTQLGAHSGTEEDSPRLFMPVWSKDQGRENCRFTVCRSTTPTLLGPLVTTLKIFRFKTGSFDLFNVNHTHLITKIQ